MAVAAEQIETLQLLSTFEDPQLVYAVSELELEQQVRIQAAEFISDTLASQAPVAEVNEVAEPIQSLYEAIQTAAEGDQNGRKVIETNVRTDVVERTMKTGHVMDPVPLAVTESGVIMQYGQTLDAVQANSLRFASDDPIMRQRVKAETRNKFRIEHLHREGWFEDYSLVVVSRAENLPEEGFFTETMSCAIQVTSKTDEGLKVESAFVAGIKNPGDEQHDAGTVVAFGHKLGKDWAGLSPAEIIDDPILVPNSLIKNGAIDLVKMYDDVGDTFFGEDKPRQDYLEYRKVCHEREERFAPKVVQIVDQLITEAPKIRNEVQATQRLHKVSEEQMIEHAVGDDDIDPRVFGPAAADIWRARQAYVVGHADQVMHHQQIAKKKAQSSSCPGAIKNVAEAGDAVGEDGNEPSETCSFISKECPRCHKKNVWTTVTSTAIIGKCGCRVSK